MTFLGGHWFPCFGFLVMSSPGFKAGVGSALFAFCGSEYGVHSPRSTSGATCANLLVAGITASPVPTYCCRGAIARIRTCALRISVSQTKWLKVEGLRNSIHIEKKFYYALVT